MAATASHAECKTVGDALLLLVTQMVRQWVMLCEGLPRPTHTDAFLDALILQVGGVGPKRAAPKALEPPDTHMVLVWMGIGGRTIGAWCRYGQRGVY